MEPGFYQIGHGAERVKNAVDLLGPDPGRIAQNAGALQDILIFQNNGRRDGKRNVPVQHSPEHDMRGAVAGAKRAQENIGVGNDHVG